MQVHPNTTRLHCNSFLSNYLGLPQQLLQTGRPNPSSEKNRALIEGFTDWQPHIWLYRWRNQWKTRWRCFYCL